MPAILIGYQARDLLSYGYSTTGHPVVWYLRKTTAWLVRVKCMHYALEYIPPSHPHNLEKVSLTCPLLGLERTPSPNGDWTL
jgi:hypothetical protein